MWVSVVPTCIRTWATHCTSKMNVLFNKSQAKELKWSTHEVRKKNSVPTTSLSTTSVIVSRLSGLWCRWLSGLRCRDRWRSGHWRLSWLWCRDRWQSGCWRLVRLLCGSRRRPVRWRLSGLWCWESSRFALVFGQVTSGALETDKRLLFWTC
jgi:hypothetical protein